MKKSLIIIIILLLTVTIGIIMIQTEHKPVEKQTQHTSNQQVAHTHNEQEHEHEAEETQVKAVTAPSISSDYLESYTIDDADFGTQVEVLVDKQKGTRTIIRNALPNHATGEFPTDGNPNAISAQSEENVYPLTPTFIGTAQSAKTIGIAINGVKLEPDTAERVVCESGEEHGLEAIQDVTSLGLDFNDAHVQPTGEYHYHGVATGLINAIETQEDLVHVAFAADGHLIYYSKSGIYQPSYELGIDTREGTDCSYTTGGKDRQTYEFGPDKDGSLKSDWTYNPALGDLDECNGIEINGEYAYLITDQYPFIGRCLMGEISEGASAQGPPGGRPSR